MFIFTLYRLVMFFRSDFRLVIRYIVGNLVHRSIFNLCVGHLFTFLLHFLSHIFSGSYVFSVLPMCWFKFICIGFSHSLIGMCYIYFACLYCLTQIPNLFSKYSKFCINISETISEEQRIFSLLYFSRLIIGFIYSHSFR